MNKQISIKLKDKAEEVARRFSDPQRSFNSNAETFTINRIIPTSETSAIVLYEKDSGKLALSFFYYISASEGYWQYFFPKESHVFGMMKVQKYLQGVEDHNFKFNEMTVNA